MSLGLKRSQVTTERRKPSKSGTNTYPLQAIEALTYSQDTCLQPTVLTEPSIRRQKGLLRRARRLNLNICFRHVRAHLTRTTLLLILRAFIGPVDGDTFHLAQSVPFGQLSSTLDSKTYYSRMRKIFWTASLGMRIVVFLFVEGIFL